MVDIPPERRAESARNCKGDAAGFCGVGIFTLQATSIFQRAESGGELPRKGPIRSAERNFEALDFRSQWHALLPARNSRTKRLPPEQSYRRSRQRKKPR